MDEQRYIIPLNYMDGGTALNGMARKRNVFEGVVLALILLLIAFLLPIPDDAKITVYVIVAGVGFLVGCQGIKGDPVSSFVMDAVKWLGRRKPYIYNNHGESFSVSASDIMLNQKYLGDSIADVIDKVRDRMAANQPEYIEGKTFRFADDPELIALRNAEKKKKAPPPSASAKKARAKKKETAAVPERKPAVSTTLDVDSLRESIVLDDGDGVTYSPE